MSSIGPAHSIFGPIAQCVADLIVEGERERLKQCGSEACEWLFYDKSRTGHRRWCSMADCGNRAKARRHYDRKRAVATTKSAKRKATAPKGTSMTLKPGRRRE